MRFSEILKDSKPFRELLERIRTAKFPISVTGVCEAAQGHLISSVCENTGSRAIVVCYTDMEAAELFKELSLYTEYAYRFPSKELIFYDVDAAGHESEHRRIRALSAWENGGIIVTSVDALMQYTITAEHFLNDRISFRTGECHNLESLREKLSSMGYSAAAQVDGIGLFSVRGGILDVFSPNMKLPVRIEFFDDEVDSIRVFDWETQRSVENVTEATVLPAREPVMNDSERQRLISVLSELADTFPEDDTVRNELVKAEDGLIFPSIDKYIRNIYGRMPSLCDYIDGAEVFIIDPARIRERFSTYVYDKAEYITELIDKGVLHGGGKEYFGDGEDISAELMRQNTVSIDVLGKGEIEFRTRQTVSFHGKIEYLYDDLEKRRGESLTVAILSQNADKAKNLCGVLSEKGYSCRFAKDMQLEKNMINVVLGSAKAGFEYPEASFLLISDREIFDGNERRTRRREDNAKRIKSYNEIDCGDYVVHRAHGIGVYDGIHKMSVNGITKDYLKVLYKDNDVLYVPVDQLDLLYKYTGAGDKPIKVNKLGGREWGKTKQKVKKSTGEMAAQLVALYAERQRTRGFAFSKDTVWQRDFEDSFVYTETEDQLRSIEEVKADMESEKPMDRLLCGDVGFGKTEVALRAAFKAVMDGKQVAYLCPTTILAMQHYNTFSDRMNKFPIKVEMLSRFRTKAQQNAILKKLKKGEIDIIIGTHRILQKDLEFSDLGLLIIDEEQRFGVAHKEKLKELKKNIDVLSMTATPIPRTLHMSMISVRDMSVLTMPPQNRYPIQTYVLENDPAVIGDAMRLELARGGQVFYLFNRVQGIYKKAEWIQSMFPDKTVRVGHGQMDEGQLEDIMHDMVTGETDILVCTTIIETGLDIPNANTIIIENADRMGLSQLYQLRGRVGRSNRKAYAYLTYQRDKIISEVAQKRLQAIKEFTEFGSGFRIALKDLEIRGAGDILGAQQHGHMDAVGYDLYCRILRESVNEAIGAAPEEEIETSIDINIDAYLPERYISDPSQRIDIYKRIAMIANDEDKMEIEDEMTDRYGDMPRAARNVVLVALLKAKARRAGISELASHGDFLSIKFAKADIAVLIGLVKSDPARYKLIPGDVPQLRVKLQSKGAVLNEADELTELLING
ncbi:MAG: transcription-repair coupling factor [Clostridia bacterium]|nr:transcription-repair coupling factor [Clostridia bacterium]